jgi:DNA (cytosine-5)-methyltransferase 1
VNTRPRLLDLFCGAGGAAMGYHRAGFDVTGVDIDPQPRYPFTFIQADALTYPLDGFDAIHASPPCQDHSMTRNWNGGRETHGTGWMLAAIRERLEGSGVPWVIENVPGAPMRADYELCGCMFGLARIRRERWFETSWQGFDLRPGCCHAEPAIPICGRGVTSYYRRRHGPVHIAERRAAMGIDWNVTREGLAQAIPPAYTEYIGRQLLGS